MTALLVTLLLSQVADELAVEEPPKLDVISLEVDSWRASGLELIQGSTALTVERAVTPHFSIAVGLVAENYQAMFANAFRGANSWSQQHTGMSAGLRALARWYPDGSAPLGFWLGAMGAAAAARGTFTVGYNPRNLSLDVRLFTSAALVGFSGVLAFDVVLQLSGGFRADFGAATCADPDGTGTSTSGWVLVSPIAYLGVGWAF